MPYHLGDTIVALASPTGGGARGVVRLSGSDAVAIASRLFRPVSSSTPLADLTTPRRIRSSFQIDLAGAPPCDLIGDLLLWPGDRSYTREPAGEFHTAGSQPVLAAVVEQLVACGARLAEPGEFTLRAFLAGRIDLTQAEAVLGVIEARGAGDLDAALDQLAGGLSRPLHRLREDLAAALAELEAGLDFVEEDIEFISRDSLLVRLRAARTIVATTISQLSTRDIAAEAPRVVITGLPNAGKSSLFNALVSRWGKATDTSAIVSPEPGATRDYVVARLDLQGMACDLVDTAGVTEIGRDEIDQAAQSATATQKQRATVHIACVDAVELGAVGLPARAKGIPQDGLIVLTKADLADHPAVQAAYADEALLCSSATGLGLDELARRLRQQLAASDGGECGVVTSTSTRCATSLRDAQAALDAAAALAGADGYGGEELIAAEVRTALDALGAVVGAVSSEDILDRIFSQFCIGK